MPVNTKNTLTAHRSGRYYRGMGSYVQRFPPAETILLERQGFECVPVRNSPSSSKIKIMLDIEQEGNY
jgi:hypothetical protein